MTRSFRNSLGKEVAADLLSPFVPFFLRFAAVVILLAVSTLRSYAGGEGAPVLARGVRDRAP